MIEQHWHPVAREVDVHSAPLGVSLLGQDWVLWRDAQGQLLAAPDQCPHRGARLSLGRVQAGQLECPYHGWRFDSHGQCTQVPALPGFVPPATHRLQTVSVQVAHGLVWLRLQAPADAATAAPLPHLGGALTDGLRQVVCGPYDVATSAPRVVENFLDMSHFSFVHEGWLGSRDWTEVPEYTVHETLHGVRATGCKAWQPRSNLHSTAPAQVEYGYEVTGPFAALLTKVPESGSTRVANWREAIGLFMAPLTPEQCRVWFVLAVADHDSPDEVLQQFQHTIFTQDQPVLESQRPRCLPLSPRAELHSAADRMSAAYRRYLQRAGITYGVC